MTEQLISARSGVTDTDSVEDTVTLPPSAAEAGETIIMQSAAAAILIHLFPVIFISSFWAGRFRPRKQFRQDGPGRSSSVFLPVSEKDTFREAFFYGEPLRRKADALGGTSAFHVICTLLSKL
jgi:hypothetical protein